MIKILFLAANPIDKDPMRLGQEARAIDEALRQAEFRDQFEIEQAWAVRVSDIQRHLLRHKPQIVHFSGHGEPTSEIILEDESGLSRPVTPHALSRLFSVLSEDVRCVVLNACYSRVQGNAIAEHIDCVVGMSTAIGDQAAIRFSAAFYQALAYGKNIQTAFELGCNLIDLAGLDEQNTPRLIAKRKGSYEQPLVETNEQYAAPVTGLASGLIFRSIISLSLICALAYFSIFDKTRTNDEIKNIALKNQPDSLFEGRPESAIEDRRDSVEAEKPGLQKAMVRDSVDRDTTRNLDVDDPDLTAITGKKEDPVPAKSDSTKPVVVPNPPLKTYEVYIDVGLMLAGANLYLNSELAGSVPDTISLAEGVYDFEIVQDNVAYGIRWACNKTLRIQDSRSIYITSEECFRKRL